MTQVHRIDLRNGNTPSRFTGSVNSSTTIITGDPDIATFNKAINCVADRNGSIYVTDFWSNTGYVRHLSKNGNVSTFLTDTDIQPIIGLGFDNSEKLLVTSWQGSGVFRRLDSTNIIRVDIFDSPTSVVSDLFGNLFVVEGGNTQALYWIDTNSVKRLLVKNRPSKFGLQNGNATMALFNVPKMSVFDSKGRLYVTDQRNGAVRMITWN